MPTRVKASPVRPYPMDPSRIKANARLNVLQAAPKRSKEAKAAGPFADLTWEQQRAAEQWLFKFCARWGNDLPPWRRGILTGVARRLAKNPPAEGWGLSMLRVRSGHGLARSCRLKGIPNPGTAALLRWHDRRRAV